MISKPKKLVQKPVAIKVEKNKVISESESEHTITEQESDEEMYARTEQHYIPSSDSDEEVYLGGINNDFHTQPKYTPQGSYNNTQSD